MVTVRANNFSTNISTRTLWPMCTRSVSTSKRLRTAITEWHQNYKPNSMRSKLNAKRLSISSKNLRNQSPRMQYMLVLDLRLNQS